MQFIYKINEKEEEEINQNLILILNKLDFVFQVSPDTKFGKFRDIPIFKKFDSSINDELKKFKEDVKNILKLMENDYEKYNIQTILLNSLRNIFTELQKQKSNIECKI